MAEFQSTCPLRGTTELGGLLAKRIAISIHMPLAGHDQAAGRAGFYMVDFNPHAPCGARRESSLSFLTKRIFQSTCPLRGTTGVEIFGKQEQGDFNPRAPCGARRCAAAPCKICACYFNPRAPCGARLSIWGFCRLFRAFQSTCPLRGTTSTAKATASASTFQSTCPLRGTTRPLVSGGAGAGHFNPRAPCGARRGVCVHCVRFARHFNPRAPCGARPPAEKECVLHLISIHVPLAGHDHRIITLLEKLRVFQSTCPLRGTTNTSVPGVEAGRFQSTCPLRGPPVRRLHSPVQSADFNPRAPCGARQPHLRHHGAAEGFQSTCPLRGTTAKDQHEHTWL